MAHGFLKTLKVATILKNPHVCLLLCLSLISTFFMGCAREEPPAEVITSSSTNPFHIVKRGETLSAIAAKYGMQKIALIRLNRLKAPYRIFIGQRLVIIPKEASINTPQSTTPKTIVNVADSGDVNVQEHSDEKDTKNTLTPLPQTLGTMGSTVEGSPTMIQENAQSAQSPSSSLEESATAMDDHASDPASSTPPPSQPKSTGQFVWPVHGQVIKGFGVDATGHNHYGINIASPLGTSVNAVESGTVLHSGNHTGGYGNLVLIQHPNGKISVYGHLQETAVRSGDAVTSGQKIGTVGTSGGVSQPQLHFELRQGKKPLNPTDYLK